MTDPLPLTGLLEVGRISKAHGLRGELLVTLVSDRIERVAPGAELSTDRGPLRVIASRPHQGRWLVQFEGVTSRESAESWRGVVLRAEPIEDADVLWVHELIGCRVIDERGIDRGTVQTVLDNPASDLLELGSGALVPLTFVVGGPVDGIVRVVVPDGLFELFEE